MPPRLTVNLGDRYGRYIIVEEVSKRNKKRYFKCKCDCGNVREVRFIALRAGEIKSCGCLRDEQNATASLSHGKSKTRLYSIWHSMKQRCLNPNNAAYQFYGERGITVCEEWREFKPFYEWAMSNGYKDILTIDRIEFEGDYEPSNCRWVTIKQQQENKRSNHWITYKGETLIIAHWSEKTGLSRETIRRRIASGWCVEDALTKSLDESKRRFKNA